MTAHSETSLTMSTVTCFLLFSSLARQCCHTMSFGLSSPPPIFFLAFTSLLFFLHSPFRLFTGSMFLVVLPFYPSILNENPYDRSFLSTCYHFQSSSLTPHPSRVFFDHTSLSFVFTHIFRSVENK